MLASEQLPSMSEIRFYLARQGWTQQPPGQAGSLWSKNNVSITVPEASDPRLSFSVIMQLAQLGQKQQADLASEVKYYSTDVTDYRAANDELDLESIPISSACAIIENIRKVIRYCGTTAFRPQGDLKAHYSSIGDHVWRSARMAHTKKGSFIVPVLVRLNVDSQADAHGRIVEVGEPETAERRVTRTIAHALRAVDQAIIQPGTEPTMDSLHTAVAMGVSRDLCIALHSLLEEPVIGELDVTFRWAPAVQASTTAPRRVSIPAESRDLIEMAADKLKTVTVEPSRTMTGTIVELRHHNGSSFGEVTISTIRNGRQVEVTVRLPYISYIPALDWHIDRRVLIVEGEVEGGRGRRLYIRSPTRCEPLDDLFMQKPEGFRLLRPDWTPEDRLSAEVPPVATPTRALEPPREEDEQGENDE
jgi:hypothetical protein